MLREHPPGPVDARRPRSLRHGDDPQQFVACLGDLAPADEEIGQLPPHAGVVGGGGRRAAVGILGGIEPTAHVVRGGDDELAIRARERFLRLEKGFFGGATVAEAKMLRDQLEPALGALRRERRGTLQDFGRQFAPTATLEKIGVPKEMVGTRFVGRGDPFGTGDGRFETPRLGVDVGGDPLCPRAGLGAESRDRFAGFLEAA